MVLDVLARVLRSWSCTLQFADRFLALVAPQLHHLRAGRPIASPNYGLVEQIESDTREQAVVELVMLIRRASQGTRWSSLLHATCKQKHVLHLLLDHQPSAPAHRWQLPVHLQRPSKCSSLPKWTSSPYIRETWGGRHWPPGKLMQT